MKPIKPLSLSLKNYKRWFCWNCGDTGKGGIKALFKHLRGCL